MTRQCESCGRFVPNRHLRTARYYYNIDHSQPVVVYSLATAIRLQERLDCPACSMECFLMREAERDYGVAIGDFPDGWERCDPQTTQADYQEAAK
jgi:hypothetical protein